MIRAFLLALACSDASVHAPDVGAIVSGDPCGRVPVATYTAEQECVRLADMNGETLFKLTESTSCGGPPCMFLQQGESGYALARVKPGHEPEWSVEYGTCEELPACCGYYPGDEWRCW